MSEADKLAALCKGTVPNAVQVLWERNCAQRSDIFEQHYQQRKNLAAFSKH